MSVVLSHSHILSHLLAITTKPLQYMFASLRDCVPLIKWTRHLESPQDLLTMFDEEVEGYLKDKVLDPLCRAVEEDLRLSSHLHLQLDDTNPYKVLLDYLFDILTK